MMRGFGLTFDGVNRFTTTKSINLGGVRISRSVYINNNANWGRWLDSFTNTTRSPITIRVAFGGQSGMGITGANSSSIVKTSSGDTIVTAADSWVEVATPLAGTTLVGGPQVTVLGTPSISARPFIGAITFAGDWLVDPFGKPLTYTGHEAQFSSLREHHHAEPRPHGVAPALRCARSNGQRRPRRRPSRPRWKRLPRSLAVAPEISDLTAAEVCSINNFDIAALTANGFDILQLHGQDQRGRPAAGAEAT